MDTYTQVKLILFYQYLGQFLVYAYSCKSNVVKLGLCGNLGG